MLDLTDYYILKETEKLQNVKMFRLRLFTSAEHVTSYWTHALVTCTVYVCNYSIGVTCNRWIVERTAARLAQPEK